MFPLPGLKRCNEVAYEYHCLAFLISRFLHQVHENSAQNKMTADNLALVFGPNILSPEVMLYLKYLFGEIYTYTSLVKGEIYASLLKLIV